MSASVMSSGGMAAIGLVSAPRSPSSSVCSFAGSVNSEILQANKYLMKTLCLAKKSQTLPGKADYANLLTSGLGTLHFMHNGSLGSQPQIKQTLIEESLVVITLDLFIGNLDPLFLCT